MVGPPHGDGENVPERPLGNDGQVPEGAKDCPARRKTVRNRPTIADRFRVVIGAQESP
jgi:hypothetical protein